MITPVPAVRFCVQGPIARADLDGLSARLCALLDANRARLAVCDVRGVEPDAVTVEALARLQLLARRRGYRVLLRGSSPALRHLIAFMGLRDVVPVPGIEALSPGAAAGRTGGTVGRSKGRT